MKETCKKCNYLHIGEDMIETENGFYLCQGCDSKRLEKENNTVVNYYYIDFNDLDIYSNEGETEYNNMDKANKLIGNSFSTFIEAKHALQAILTRNIYGENNSKSSRWRMGKYKTSRTYQN